MYGVPTQNSNQVSTRNLDSVDPDLDFLSTYSEEIFNTDPFNNDSDEDGMLDGWEVTYGLNPNNDDAFSTSTETYFIASGNLDSLDGVINAPSSQLSLAAEDTSDIKLLWQVDPAHSGGNIFQSDSTSFSITFDFKQI